MCEVSLAYGFFVGLLNLILSRALLHWHQTRVTKVQGQTLKAVLHSMIARVVIITLLLVLGFSQLQLDNNLVLIGFVFGQVFYLFNQIFGIVKYGK